jgi:NADH dehydrogenase FAD-containing subunit
MRILRTRWGAASFLKDINADLVDAAVISPHNYFLFTPMLAGWSKRGGQLYTDPLLKPV